MSQEVTRIKLRIKSVSDALKVTSAMKLVSTVKLKKWKNKMLANRDYASEIEETTLLFLAHCKKYKTPLAKANNGSKNLYIIISSTLGLCGSYNNNVFKVADAAIKDEDEIIVLGGKGLTHYLDGPNHIIDGFNSNNNVTDTKLIDQITQFAISEYLNGTYKEVHLIYSSYKNSLIFLAQDYVLLPLKNKEVDDISFSPILEPSEKELMETLIPIYIKTNIHSKFLESEVCEYASRSNAMENATNNANELLDGLNIEFNKARQGAITQEIIEVVGASNKT